MMKPYFNPVGVLIVVTIIIGILIPVREFLHSRYSARLSRALWLILALRLILPFGIQYTESRKAIVNIQIDNSVVWQNNDAVQNKVIIAPDAEIKTETNTENTSGEAVITENAVTEKTESATENIHAETQTENQTVVYDENKKFEFPVKLRVSDILMMVWLSGAVIAVNTSVVRYAGVRRKIRLFSYTDGRLTQITEKLCTKNGIKEKVQTVYCTLIDVPLLTGIINPVIILPENEYSDLEAEMIISHELTHLVRKDILYKAVLQFASCLYWFNPVIKYMTEMADEDIEYACDEQLLNGKKPDYIADYAQSIMKVISMQHSGKVFMTTAFGSGRKSIMMRFRNIFDKKSAKKGRGIITRFVCGIVLAGSFIGCSEKTYLVTDSMFEKYANLDGVEYIYRDKILNKNLDTLDGEGCPEFDTTLLNSEWGVATDNPDDSFSGVRIDYEDETRYEFSYMAEDDISNVIGHYGFIGNETNGGGAYTTPDKNYVQKIVSFDALTDVTTFTRYYSSAKKDSPENEWEFTLIYQHEVPLNSFEKLTNKIGFSSDNRDAQTKIEKDVYSFSGNTFIGTVEDVRFVNENYGYLIAVNDYSETPIVYVTFDSGKNWTQMDFSRIALTSLFTGYKADSLRVYGKEIKIYFDVVNADEYDETNVKNPAYILVSTDCGKTWEASINRRYYPFNERFAEYTISGRVRATFDYDSEEYENGRKYAVWADDSGKGNTGSLGYDGLLYTNTSSNKAQFTDIMPYQGMYGMVSNNLIWLMYPDGTSGIRCKIEGCTHLTDSCRAHIDSGAVFFENDGKLYCMDGINKNGYRIRCIETDNLTQISTVVQLTEPEGSTNEGPFYYVGTTNDRVIFGRSSGILYSVYIGDDDLSDSERVVKSSDTIDIDGTFDIYNGTLIYTKAGNHFAVNGDYGSRVPYCNTFTINPETLEFSLVDGINCSGTPLRMNNGYMWCIGDNKLERINLENGQTDIIVNNLEDLFYESGGAPYPVEEESGIIWNYMGDYSNKLIIHGYVIPTAEYRKENMRYRSFEKEFVLNTENGDIKQLSDDIKTQINKKSELNDYTPVAALGDYYVMILSNRMYYDTIGLCHWQSELGLIPKTDYENGIIDNMIPAGTVTSAG